MQKLYRLYDSKSETWSPLHEFETDAAAIRSLSDAVNRDSQDNVTLHPEDFTLFCVGGYDDHDPLPEVPASPISITTALSLRKVSGQRGEAVAGGND